MPPKIPPADPLTGQEVAVVIQGGKPVRTTTQNIANRGPVTPGPPGKDGTPGTPGKDGPPGKDGSPGAAGVPKRVERFSAATNASGIATIAFDPVFAAVPDIQVIDGWIGDQQVTGGVVAGTATKSGCQIQVMVSRGTLILTTGPYQKAAAGVSVTVRAIGN